MWEFGVDQCETWRYFFCMRYVKHTEHSMSPNTVQTCFGTDNMCISSTQKYRGSGSNVGTAKFVRSVSDIARQPGLDRLHVEFDPESKKAHTNMLDKAFTSTKTSESLFPTPSKF